MKTPNNKARTVSFRCPEDLHGEAQRRIAEEGIDFSKFVRRAVRRQIEVPQQMGPGKKEPKT
ncbi:MAG TPA: hypothetical protein VIM58_09200 [Candidatus Methylacidiphilales bacterium]